jgi:hypothetical protein
MREKQHIKFTDIMVTLLFVEQGIDENETFSQNSPSGTTVQSVRAWGDASHSDKMKSKNCVKAHSIPSSQAGPARCSWQLQPSTVLVADFAQEPGGLGLRKRL